MEVRGLQLVVMKQDIVVRILDSRGQDTGYGGQGAAIGGYEVGHSG